VPPDVVERVWSALTETYFLRHSPAEIAWHTRLLADRDPEDRSPVVAVSPEPGPAGATAIVTCNSIRRHSFARTTAALDQMGLNIVDARIVPTSDGQSLDTYLVLEDTGQAIADADRLVEIERSLRRTLSEPESAPTTVTRRAPRQVRMFTTPTQVAFSEDSRNQRTILEIAAGDRPGLLSEIAKVLWQEGVDLHGAKIVTVGERAEDVFYVTDESGRPLGEPLQARLGEALARALDRRDAAA
jgi:[protein-PII] uridylyltransferase